MPKDLGTFLSMKIGCDNAVAVRLKTDTPGQHMGREKKYEWETDIINLPGVMEITVNSNPSQDTAFYDNGPGEVASTLGNIEISFEKSSLNTQEMNFLLGRIITPDGVAITTSQESAPYVAFGFRSLRSDGTYRFVWLLKGKFILGQEDQETKQDTINFQNENLTGRFVAANAQFCVDSTVTPKVWKSLWKVEKNADASATAEWFSQNPVPEVDAI